MVFFGAFWFQINVYRKPRRYLKNWWSANRLKFWKYYRGQKINFSIFFHFGIRQFRLDERIPYLVSKLKSDNIWRPFLATKRSKSGKCGYFASYWPFSIVVFGQKWRQMLPDFNLETRFGILSFRLNFLSPKWKKIKQFLFSPYSISKTSITLRFTSF